MAEPDTAARRVQAAAAGQADFGQHGSSREHIRYAEPWPDEPAGMTRRRCNCCKQRVTHLGMANGVALMSGCEMRVRRWVRDG